MLPKQEAFLLLPLVCFAVSERWLVVTALTLQVMYTLCNIVSHGESMSAEVVNHGAMAKVVPLLKVFDLELLHMALAFVEATLRYSEIVSDSVKSCTLEKMCKHLYSGIMDNFVLR